VSEILQAMNFAQHDISIIHIDVPANIKIAMVFNKLFNWLCMLEYCIEKV
jgi:hypothetical protein